MISGNLILLLHAHLPFVRNPDHPRFFEENWLFEALTECYIPVLQMLGRMVEKGLPGTINLSLSPTLMSMLQDSLLRKRYSEHLEQMLDLAEREIQRLASDPDRLNLAKYYRDRLRSVQHSWEVRFERDLISVILGLRERGKVEVVTCVGTHPFLPAYQAEPSVIRYQLALTQQVCHDILGFQPRGLWLPECGFFEGLDSLVSEFGFELTFLETHGVLLSRPGPKFGVFEPIQTSSGLTILGRDQASSKEVWSRRVGYPGHPQYREFFTDLAWEQPRDYLGEYFMAAGNPIGTGIKYYRITGSEPKELYEPYKAIMLAREHGKHFIANREKQMGELTARMDGKPCLLAPYDAELFGHWWYEGPEFLESVIERAAWSDAVDLVGVSSLLDQLPAMKPRIPNFSSWGEGGYGSVWINTKVDWIYPKIFEMLTLFRDSFRRFRTGGFSGRVLSQMGRELALIQSSDWAFMIHNHSAADYARARVQEHYDNFKALRRLLLSGRTQSKLLNQLEKRNNLFPHLGPEQYRMLAR